MIKVLLAEDHQIVRNGIRSMLEREPEFEVVADADNGVQALSILRTGLKVDVVLTDISMPEMDGISLTKTIRPEFPDTKVVVLSMMDNENYIFDAFDAGVNGYILKNASFDEMIFAIRHAAGGPKQNTFPLLLFPQTNEFILPFRNTAPQIFL